MKICYTAIFGNYDQLHAPTVITPGWKYVCITDDPNLKVPAPYIKALVSTDLLPEQKLAARQMKIVSPYPEATLTVWHDANIQVCCNLDELVETFAVCPITVMKHPTRSTILEEMHAVVELKKDNADNVNKLFGAYQYFLSHHREPKLAATGVVIRKNSDPMITKLQAEWWHLVKNNSHRDQLSFGIAAGELKIPISYMPFEVIHGSHFQWRPHLR